jgi:uncharacterized protein YoxC
MKTKSIFTWLMFFLLTISITTSCVLNSQKNEGKNSTTKNVISEELHQEHCDLLAKANKELADINQKVRELNEKIHEKGGKLTDEQNKALDDFEAKQISINRRVHEIKNVKQENWENFKITFEKDLEEIKNAIDNILSGM